MQLPRIKFIFLKYYFQSNNKIDINKHQGKEPYFNQPTRARLFSIYQAGPTPIHAFIKSLSYCAKSGFKGTNFDTLRNPQRKRYSRHGISFISFELIIDKHPDRQWSQIYTRALFSRAWIQRYRRQRSPSQGGGRVHAHWARPQAIAATAQSALRAGSQGCTGEETRFPSSACYLCFH